MKGMKKRYLAWSLMISLLTGTLFGNSGISWASEKINSDKAINVESEENSLENDSTLSTPSNARSDNADADVEDDVKDEEGDLWEDYDLSTPSDATEIATSSNATLGEADSKSTGTIGLQEEFVTEDGIIIVIDSQNVLLPEDTQIQIKKVDLGSEIMDSVRTSMEENQKELEQIYAYDISFWSEGEEFEPSDGVKVTFKFPDTMTEEQVDGSEIFHVKDGEDAAEFVPKTVEGDQEISCQSVGFSVYGIAVAQTEEWIPIYTIEDFKSIFSTIDKSYKLMNDLDFENVEWTPQTFTGRFDGQGYTISNLCLDKFWSYHSSYGWGSNVCGLFGGVKAVTNDAFVKNLKIKGCNVNFPDYDTSSGKDKMVGAIAGLTESSNDATASIENCDVIDCTIQVVDYPNITIGGVAGLGDVKNSSFDGEIEYKTKVSNSKEVHIGGIVGSGTVEECINAGMIEVERDFRSYGNSDNVFVGGIAGLASGDVKKCVNYGDVYAKGINDDLNYKHYLGVGGIAGCESHIIENCYNTGNITASAGLNSNNEKGLIPGSGGIVGYYVTGSECMVRNCYNIGEVKSLSENETSCDLDVHRGGICGIWDTDPRYVDLDGIADFQNCYSSNKTIGYCEDFINELVDNTKECTLDDLKDESTYTGFDFENVWKMGLDDYPYPVLQSQDEAPSQPDIPDTSDSDDQLGWVNFENGEVGYYVYQNNKCQLLKSGIFKLNYTDQKGVIFSGNWKFDENGYVVTGMHGGLYYCEDKDGTYPYGMCIPDKGYDGILKEQYNQSKIRPSTVLSRYSFISTYMDDMNYMSYILSANIDDGWMLLTGNAFLRLAKQLGFVGIDDINVEYLKTESNNRKILGKVLDIKFPEKEETEDIVVLADSWDDIKDEKGLIEFIAKKIKDVSKNEDKYSDSFAELAKEVKKKESEGETEDKILGSVAAQSYKTFDTIMEQANGWSDALKDYSEKISYLKALEESIDHIDSGKIKNIQNLKNAVSELRKNYEERIKLQVYETCFAVIDQGNSWAEVLTGEKKPLTGWDFKESPKYNMSKVVADVIKDLGEESIPLLKDLGKAITMIQIIDGRPEAVNTIAQTQMLYTVAYDVLREKEDEFLVDGDSESLADYLNAFEFMRCITILRYQNMKKVYDSTYCGDGLKRVKADFLQKEIDKLERISPLNYYENEFASMTFAGSWDESGEKFYYGTNGDERFYIENRWAYIDGERYYFDQTGRVLIGVQKIKDETGEGEYYFSTGDGSEHNKDHRGAMQTGPIELNGKEYYYDSNPGVNRGRKIINSLIEIGPKDYRYYGPDGAYDREKSGFSEVTDTDPNHKFFEKGGIRYATNCPVDIIIYDENDNMVGNIINNQPQNVTDDEIDVYIDVAGQKIVGVPLNSKYKLEIIARASGTMDYSVAEFASDGSGLIGKTDYRAVTLNQADHFYGITESLFYDGVEHNSYRLLKENTEIASEEYQDTMTSYLVNTSVEGHGTVEGNKQAIRGDFVKLIARPNTGYEFTGWYDADGNCVSKDSEFRFRVLEEQNLIAKFTEKTSSGNGSGNTDSSSGGTGSGGSGTGSSSSSGSGSGESGSGSSSSGAGSGESSSSSSSSGGSGSNGSTSSSSSSSSSGSSGGSGSSGRSSYTSYMPGQLGTTGWIKDGKGWWYRKADGTWPHDEWCELEFLGRKDWYYFDKNGYVVSGWLKWNESSYYLNPISNGWFGRMETGWKNVDGKWYFFEPVLGRNQGHLFVNTVTPDGYKVDSNGVWIE